MADFLLEIGLEEIPDWMIAPALEHLRGKIAELLPGTLGGTVTLAEATPRRLVVGVTGVQEATAEKTVTISGPPVGAADKAIEGFAKKNNVDRAKLEEINGKWSLKVVHPGVRTADFLAEQLPAIILGIPWPKTMVWLGKGTERFIRPLRWIVCLLGDQVVKFQVAGILAGNQTWGRRDGPRIPKAEVTTANYQQVLARLGIILSISERKTRILNEAAKVLPAGMRLRPDEALVETLAGITEYPTPILGSFDESYLKLPSEVLVTVMRHHQKYFSVETTEGKLAPHFVAVMNTDADPDGLVRHGNERVLRARFNDARFFYDTDQKKPLKDRVADLANVTFQAQLGSYLEKTKRMEALVKELGGSAAAQEAARLAKTDLTNEMVKEFTELQGQIGGIYAIAQGHGEAVGQAIYEHYKPVSMEDTVPSTAEGQMLSLADKVDTLRGCFRVGMIPKGSSDPFALRRAAQGVVKILVEGELALTVPQLTGGDAQLEGFLRDRVDYYFREIRGFAYDEVNAVLASGWSDLKEVLARLEAVKAVRATANFEPLAAAFKRIKNILKQAQFEEAGAIDTQKLEPGPEQALHADYLRVKDAAAASANHGETLAVIATLRPAVDAFFDKVMVNVEDAAVRRNRLTLLRSLLTEFSTLADFSEIVTKS